MVNVVHCVYSLNGVNGLTTKHFLGGFMYKTYELASFISAVELSMAYFNFESTYILNIGSYRPVPKKINQRKVRKLKRQTGRI